jgi:hypothetical protein
MKIRLTAAAAVAAMSIFGCGGGSKAVEINPGAKPVGTRWNAVLATPASMVGAVQIQGTGYMEADADNPQQTHAHVSIRNAAPGGEHPWHVHVGRCGTDQGIFGPPESYGILRVGDKGLAEGDATIPLAFPRAGQYFVNVHASKENMGTIVACGNLAAPAR